jgi:NTP pyrophosphatase (non-canonical NTP hydrolase)
MTDGETTVLHLREGVAAFVRERDWEQFHNPKDLAAAIAIEAAELQELFLWQGPDQVEQTAASVTGRERITEELADVLILCLSLANRLEVDIAEAVERKMAANAAKYPAERVRGRADKYTSYLDG